MKFRPFFLRRKIKTTNDSTGRSFLSIHNPDVEISKGDGPDSRPSPPRPAAWMVRTLHRYRFLHSICEDLEDGYTARYQNSRRLSADVWYWKETFGAFFKEHLFNFRWSFIMIKNYLTVALRNIRKHKGYSL
ncbi:MAG: hypothetical protein MUP70_03710, partial [Candidatus Aminicenantes bacterium]|nr:hypothetical protein [Candidatus Aminicenantes bacterium]